jgi:hypothetical protein
MRKNSSSQVLKLDILGELGFHIFNSLLNDLPKLPNCYQTADANKAGDNHVLNHSLAFVILNKCLHKCSFVASKAFRARTETKARPEDIRRVFCSGMKISGVKSGKPLK